MERDHKKLGQQLGLFYIDETVGKGLPMLLSKGAALRRELERFIVDEEIKRGYNHVYTPDLARLELYKKSGHYPHYQDSMYAPITIDDEEFMLRPMTCPHHFQLYLSRPHSYRELPMRIAEVAKLYRYEQSGELMGLQRVRTFCLSDAHIICASEEQAVDEMGEALDLIEYANGKLGLEFGTDYSYRLSLGDRKNTEKYYKDDKGWEKAEDLLRKLMKKRGVKFEEAKNEAAFYGPKIDIQMKNANGKEDTAFTVQYDLCMPERFNLAYIGEDGKEHRAFVVHRSSIGAIERIATRFGIEPRPDPLDEATAPVVDIEALRAGVRGNDKLLRELISLFREDSYTMLADMKEAIETRDPPRLASTAHAFVGSLGNFAARRAFARARELERRARENDWNGIEAVYSSLVEETERLEDELGRIRIGRIENGGGQ